VNAWNRIKDSDAGLAYSLSDAMATLELQFPGYLVPVNEGRMIVASDYSGQHRQSSHEVYSFLVTTEDEITQWKHARDVFRKHSMTDGRRMSFKQLRDKVRANALPDFLQLGFKLRGNLISIMVDKRIPSFLSGGLASVRQLFAGCIPTEAPHGTAEKMYLLATLQAMIIAGLRQESQEALWISDSDETLDENDKREGIAQLISYLTFAYTKWRQPAELLFTTTGSSNSPEWAEELAALPDIIAGALCASNKYLPACFDRKKRHIAVLDSRELQHRNAGRVLDWLALHGAGASLRNVLLRLEVNDAGSIRSSYQFIAGGKLSKA